MHTILKVFRKVALSFHLISVSFSNVNCTVHKNKSTCTLPYARSNVTTPWITTLAHVRDDNIEAVPTFKWKALLPLRNNTVHFLRVCVYALPFHSSVEEKWRYWRSKIDRGRTFLV